MDFQLWFGKWLVLSWGLIGCAQTLQDPLGSTSGKKTEEIWDGQENKSLAEVLPTFGVGEIDTFPRYQGRVVPPETKDGPLGTSYQEVWTGNDLTTHLRRQSEEDPSQGGKNKDQVETRDEPGKFNVPRSRRKAFRSDSQPKSSTHVNRSPGRHLKLGDDEDGSEVIGAFASLPPPTDDRVSKSRRDGVNPFDDSRGFEGDRFDGRHEDRVSQWFPPRLENKDNPRSRGNRLFPEDHQRRPNFDDRSNPFNRFLDTSLTEIENQGPKRGPWEQRNPVVEHSIFVNTQSDDALTLRPTDSFGDKGPIIIQRGDPRRGRPVLIDLENRSRPQQRPGRPHRSKFGPVITTIHGRRGNRDIVIRRPLNDLGPSIPDSSFSFNKNFGIGDIPRREQPLLYNPRQNFNNPPVIQVSSPNPKTNHLPHLEKIPPKSPDAARISFFPDLGVNVNHPSRIQPKVGPTIQSNVRKTSGRDSSFRRDRTSDGNNPFQNPPRSFPFNERNWKPSFIQDLPTHQSSSRPDLRPTHDNRLLPLDSIYPLRPYSFGYSVNAPSTSDHKAVYEERGADGRVRGQYSFLQPDGLFRRVTYEADGERGFRADVRYIPT